MRNLRERKAIGTCSYVSGIQYVPEKFSYSYGQMLNYNGMHIEKPDKYIFYDRVQSSWLPRSRNDIVKSIRGDWVFMVDVDLQFDPDCLYQMLRLMDKYKAPVLTGLYVYKKYPHFPVLYSWNDIKEQYQIIAKWQKDAEIFQVDAAGAGCLLVKKFVFDMIWDKLDQDPFDTIGNMGEDMSFYTRLRKVGVGAYCAPNVRFSHLQVTPTDYDESRFGDKLISKSYLRSGGLDTKSK